MSNPIKNEWVPRLTYLSRDLRFRLLEAGSWKRFSRAVGVFVVAACISSCAVGPDYRKPQLVVPPSFKEYSDWQRAEANPRGAILSNWWIDYHDDALSQLVEHALNSNQSIAAAEASYRLAMATVDANKASFFPTVGTGLSGTRSGTGAGASSTGIASVTNGATADVSANWELDLWGQIRREVESAKASAQASDAELAGERLSIAASVVADYFALRQADIDIELLEQQKAIDARILEMTRGGLLYGTASNDDVLTAQDTLEAVIANLQSTQISREQDEHAIAVLTGTPPATFSLPARRDYVFVTPVVPLGFPSQLLERRYDVVSAERTAAAANAKIGVAKAAFFPTLTLSAEGGFEHNTLANLFTVPSRFWTLGPDLAATIFDGGARTAAVHEAEATYDADVATYRETVLTAFQNVEDSLSSYNHIQAQERSFASIYERNRKLLSSQQTQLKVGTTSEQGVLTQQLTLLQAEQNLRDTQASLTESTVTLIKNLGGGWKSGDAKGAAEGS